MATESPYEWAHLALALAQAALVVWWLWRRRQHYLYLEVLAAPGEKFTQEDVFAWLDHDRNGTFEYGWGGLFEPFRVVAVQLKERDTRMQVKAVRL